MISREAVSRWHWHACKQKHVEVAVLYFLHRLTLEIELRSKLEKAGESGTRCSLSPLLLLFTVENTK